MRIGKPRLRNELTPVTWALFVTKARSAVCGVLVWMVATFVVAEEESKPRLVGSTSCAAAACHGGLAGRKVVGSEFPLWAARDPHSRAYSVLLNDDSKQMAARLKLSGKTAHESVECLKCHSPATVAKGPALTDHAKRAGVDCEQCHGAAERWLAPHSRKDWKQLSPEVKQRLGYTNLADVLTRATLCTECHVGGPDRDVNHDLLAAGHPRLFFELSTFHANWPKHWPRKTDDSQHPVPDAKPNDPPGSLFEAKLWAIGQVVTAQRSLELLSQRASHSRTWPEFAEWNCFACHHDLESDSWWQRPHRQKKHPHDALSWNSWPYALLEPLARQTFGSEFSSSASPISRTLRLSPLFTTLRPPQELIATEADAAAKSLHAWAEQLNDAVKSQQLLSPDALKSLRESLISQEGQQLVARDWDSATQVFLAINALRYAEKGARGRLDSTDEAQIQAVLDSMRKSLDFQNGYRGPRQPELRQLDTLLSTPPDSSRGQK